MLPVLPLLYFLLLNAVIIIAGYIVIKNTRLTSAWVMLVFSVAVIGFVFRQIQPVIKMLAIIATTFTAMKVVTATESYKGKTFALTFKQWLVFAAGWAGMRAQPFETLGAAAIPGARGMIRFGISRLLAGALLIGLAHLLVKQPINPTFLYIAVSALLLVAFSLILHFGLLSISAGSWRLWGVHTYYLFNRPATALSLTEFWGKRWNVAFSEMTTLTLFRPLRHKAGNAAALMAAFLFSGLLHELALSVPVNKGYGLPLLYFFIQGLLVLLEKALTLHHINFLEHKIIARAWVFFWLVVPMPLLFHAAFLQEVVWPLAGLQVK
ncbi:MBOAT family protein [Mucilaginibacter sp.]